MPFIVFIIGMSFAYDFITTFDKSSIWFNLISYYIMESSKVGFALEYFRNIFFSSSEFVLTRPNEWIVDTNE